MALASDPKSNLSLADEVWELFTAGENDHVYVSDDDGIEDSLMSCVQRRDGTPMTEDDDAALVPYSGLVSLVTTLRAVPGKVPAAQVDWLESPTGGPLDDEADYFGLPFESVLSRNDGKPMDDQDEAALLEYGGLTALFFAMATTPLVGDLEGSSTGDRMDGPRWTRQSEPIFAGVADEPTELALLEFGSLATLTAFLPPLAPAPSSLGAWPEADDALATLGEEWGREWAASQKVLHDGVDHEAGAYGTFDASISRLASRLALAVWNRIFGTSLGDVAAVANHNRGNRSDDALSSRDGGDGRMKKKPSGAELSAYIGKATQAALGLANPSRKVHARGVF
jgi:hypothetical protein